MAIMGLAMAAAPAGEESISNTMLLARAEAAFDRGVAGRLSADKGRESFATAAADYEALRQQGLQNAALFRNQGNAYLLAADLARAILAYRRGLRIAPGDRALQTNLAYARKQVESPPSGSAARFSWVPRLPPAWLWLGLAACYSTGWLGVTRCVMVRQLRPLRLAFIGLALGAVLGAGLVVEAWDSHDDAQYPLVIIAKDKVRLRKGNGFSYPVRDDMNLNRGVEARLLYRRGEWLQIELSDGKIGWVPLTDALLDEDHARMRSSSGNLLPNSGSAEQPSHFSNTVAYTERKSTVCTRSPSSSLSRPG
jgi:hypothetical protein